ncbi:MAG: hypothetical protein MI741_11600 [Rhodospirillales bacterium]|nr:hypothetical protein [Rhodospirillales bacterium]
MFGLANDSARERDFKQEAGPNLWVVGEAQQETPAANAEPPQIRVFANRVLFEERDGCGTVFVVYLGEFFRALGGRTDRFANALRLMAEAIFRDRLSPEDIFCFHPHGYFTIRTAGSDHSAAREQVEALVDNLGQRAIGERYVSWQFIHAMESRQVA